jgi:hypothetical protein
LLLIFAAVILKFYPLIHL